MAGFFGKWSKTAATNATADSTVNWAEGQAPSSVNDSARAMMASAASYRDDTSGSLVVGGTSTAYTLTTNQAFASTTDLDGQEISFVITPTNGASATLNVNAIGAYPLSFSAGNPMPAGSLVDGSVYTATFSLSLSCWKVRSYFGNPFNIPVGGLMDYICPAVPNANFVFPTGQAISRTTYAVLFALIGTTYGVGDGSTTFNVPDLTGRVTAMKEASATRLTSTYFVGDSTALGATGGLESAALSLAQLPTGITSSGVNGITVLSSVSDVVRAPNGVVSSNATGGINGQLGANTALTAQITSTGNNAISVTSSNTSGSSHKNVQPTIIVNKILRII